LALYAADIEVRLKNKGELTRLEKQFKKLADVSIQLDKTLKSLGKSNVIRVDTRGALSAINQLETKIKGLSRTVSVNASTSGGGRRSEGGMSGMAVPMMAAAMSGGNRRGKPPSIFSKDDDSFQSHIRKLGNEIKLQESIVESYGETASRAQNKHAKAVENLNNHQDKTTKTLRALDQSVEKSPLTKFTKGFLPATAGKNLITFSKAYLRTNSKVAETLQEQNRELVNQVTSEKGLKEISEGNLRNQEKKLQRKQEVTRLTESETEATIRNALMTDHERGLHNDINKAKTKGFEALAQSYRQQEQINEALEAGRTPATKLTNQFEKSKQKIKKNFQEVVRLREELSKPIPQTGMMGIRGMMGSFGGGMKSLGKGGMLQSFGKGALGASAMIPGMAPFAIGAGLGGAGKTGGAALAGGAAGIGGAGLLMGGIALAGIAKESAVAQAEFKKMKVALEGVTPSYAEYSNALDHVSELSDKYANSQKDTIKNFTKLQASASASGFSVDEVAEAYEGLQAGTIATGGDMEKLNGVMLAASQIFAKGKVAAEEIRGQISERLPGTMALFAESMGISGKALDKLLQEGKVTMEDFLNFTRHLKKVHGETALSMVEDSSNAGQKLSKEWDDLILNIGTITQPVGAALQRMLAGVLEDINDVSEGFIKLLGLTKETKIDNQLTRREKLEEDIKSAQETGKFKFPQGAQDILGNLGTSLKNLGASGSQFSLNPTITQSQILESQDLIGRGGLPGKSMGPGQLKGTDESFNNKLREWKMLTAAEVERAEKMKDTNAVSELGNEIDKAKVAKWKEIEDQLKSQIQYQNDLNEKGQEYADTQKMINDLVNQFGEKREVIEGYVNTLKDLEKQGKSTKAVLNDWLDELEDRLNELKNPMEQFKSLVEAAGDSFQSDFKEMIKGSISVGDAMVNMFNRIADAYLDMVAEMIAAQAKMAMVKFIGNIFGGGIDTMGATPTNTVTSAYGSSTTYYTGGSGTLDYASGGYVDRPTNALIGEAGPEYVLRDDQMQGALARYASGQRGQSVIPGGSYSDQPSGGVGGVTVAYTGPTLNFNGDEYVPKSSVPQIINAAAKQGASAGQAKALSSLKNSRSARSRVGI